MKIIPILNRILVKPIIEKETIIRPDNAKKEPIKGIVIESSVPEIKKGSHILWKELTGIYIGDYIIINSSDVLAVYDILSGRNYSN